MRHHHTAVVRVLGVILIGGLAVGAAAQDAPSSVAAAKPPTASSRSGEQSPSSSGSAGLPPRPPLGDLRLLPGPPLGFAGGAPLLQRAQPLGDLERAARPVTGPTVGEIRDVLAQ